MFKLTNLRVSIRIALIITVMETLIMMLLHSLPTPLSPRTEVFVDALLLILLSTPLIYLTAVRPFERSYLKALEQLEKLANTDVLTGLGNRREIFSAFKRTVSTCARHNRYGAVLMIDLDEFKTLNDQYGHDSGDRLLKELGSRLRQTVRKEDSVGRLGGDEFMVLASDIGNDEESAIRNSLKFGHLLLEEISRPANIQGRDLSISASIGIRLLTPDYSDPLGIYREVDDAMYQAKARGKGTVVVLNTDGENGTKEVSP